ncbi:MAG: DUF3098 domain-containing protein [Saprospiraceae bacterium]|nr:DUF3098 domain-containing protein [Saprospiraceae bacterium]
MAKANTKKKKVITTKTVKTEVQTGKGKVVKNKVKTRRGGSAVVKELAFGKSNFQLVIVGLVLMALGMILMMGGGMPSPDVWDESLIYSFRRITLAPILIIAGLIVEIFAIFRD